MVFQMTCFGRGYHTIAHTLRIVEQAVTQPHLRTKIELLRQKHFIIVVDMLFAIIVFST